MLEPQNEYAYFNRGYSYSALGQYELAISEYNAAIGIHPQYYMYTNRGIAYSKLGETERVLQDFDSGVETLSLSSSTILTN